MSAPELDFTKYVIKIRSTGDKWGPYSFDLEGKIPTGDTLSGAVVKSYDNDTDAETTTQLIEPDTTAVDGTAVQVAFQYPGDNYTGYHYLGIEATMASGAKNTFIYGYVKVEKEGA
jgi:hypothetical protein